ncbi:MAG: hypothetical protein H6Q72_1211 [Firmicutes bacterium]|nr:hypothetical protein [Bacillota bacterium]
MNKVFNLIEMLFVSMVRPIARLGCPREKINQMVSIKYDINRKID